MKKLTDLLFEAAMHYANMSNPAAIPTGESALDEVRKFMAVEDEIYSIPGAMDELSDIILMPLDPTGTLVNHAMMGGLILARSDWPDAASVLIRASKHSDSWCAAMARLNLYWLTPCPDAANALLEEFEASKDKKEFGHIPELVLAEALIRQRSIEIMPVILSYINGDAGEHERASLLTSLVTLMPEQGLLAAEKLEMNDGIVSLTALGLRAVYNGNGAYDELLAFSPETDDEYGIFLKWIGRIPRPESVSPLLNGLSHQSSMVRCDVVTSLALFGLKASREAVIRALFDSATEVSSQSMSLLFEWLGDDLWNCTQHWKFDTDGRLAKSSIYELQMIAEKSLEEMNPDLRYHGKMLYLPVHNLEDLYRTVLPDHTWYHWVSTTGTYEPYDIHRIVLYNFPTLEKLEDWHLVHESDFKPGGLYYHGKSCV